MRALIAVEGPHDIEVVGRMLEGKGLARVRTLDSLTPEFVRLVPRSFPARNDLLARVPVPVFFQGQEEFVAVQASSEVIALLRDMRTAMGPIAVDAFGAIADADSNDGAKRFGELASEWRRLIPDLSCPGDAGVPSGTPRTGIYVVPDCSSSGTIEDLLLESGQKHYSHLLASATSYVAQAEQIPTLRPEDLREIRKPAGRKKAILSAAASILRPGRAIQVSIQDDRWLAEPVEVNSHFGRLSSFLGTLLS